MDFLQLLRCQFGSHRRDRPRAWHDGPVVRSHCTGCGKPMIKDKLGWHLDVAPAPEAPVTGD